MVVQTIWAVYPTSCPLSTRGVEQPKLVAGQPYLSLLPMWTMYGMTPRVLPQTSS